jgi:hypothetical protein
LLNLWTVASEDIRELTSRDRRAEVETLAAAAKLLLQHRKLLFVFYPFRNHTLLQAAAHSDDRLDDRGVVAVLVETGLDPKYKASGDSRYSAGPMTIERTTATYTAWRESCTAELITPLDEAYEAS